MFKTVFISKIVKFPMKQGGKGASEPEPEGGNGQEEDALISGATADDFEVEVIRQILDNECESDGMLLFIL